MVWVWVRNNNVFHLRINVAYGCYGYLMYCINQYKDDEDFQNHKAEYFKTKEMMEEIMGRYSYGRQMFSIFKKLNMEDWYSREEIDLMKKGIATLLEEGYDIL